MREHGENAGDRNADERRNDEVLPQQDVDDERRECAERHIVAMREVTDPAARPKRVTRRLRRSR